MKFSLSPSPVLLLMLQFSNSSKMAGLVERHLDNKSCSPHWVHFDPTTLPRKLAFRYRL